MRTQIQAMSDRLLLLYAIGKGNESGCVDGPFKLMKIPFMAELASTSHGVNTFNYSFYRWTYGPMSTEIYEDADALHALGLSSSKNRNARVTPKGMALLNIAGDLFSDNRAAVKYVDDASRKCAQLGFGQLKKLVYGQSVMVGGKKTLIADVPSGVGVLSSAPDAKLEFALDDDWVDTLWGYFNYSSEDFELMKIVTRAPHSEFACQ